MKRIITNKKVSASLDKNSTDTSVHKKVAKICREVLDLVDMGIITDDEYDDVREILHRYLDR